MSRHEKGKTNMDLLEQEIVSGSGKFRVNTVRQSVMNPIVCDFPYINQLCNSKLPFENLVKNCTQNCSFFAPVKKLGRVSKHQDMH